MRKIKSPNLAQLLMQLRFTPEAKRRAELEALEKALASKAKYVLRATKRQMHEIRGGTFDARHDAEALLGALKDPESMEQGMRYVAARIQKKSG